MINEKIHIGQDFSGQDLSSADLSGHKFIACDFSRAISSEATKWYGGVFQGCTMHYFNAENSIFDRCAFSYCDLKFSNFKKSKLTQSQAIWCDFGGSSFKDADAHSFSTSNCDFFTSRIQYARINPYSRDMIAEIVRIDSGDDWAKLMMAAFIKCSPDMCWRDFAVVGKTENYKKIGEEILAALVRHNGLNEKELERYNTHDVIE